MKETVGRTLFDELAKTGALKIPPGEAEALRAELNAQLEVIRQLNSIPLDAALPPVVHGNPYPPEIRCTLREDEWTPFGNPGEIIAQFPLSREGYAVSPETTTVELSVQSEE